MLTNNFRRILNYMFKNETLVIKDNIVGLDGKIIESANGDSIPLEYLNKSKQAILTSDSTTEGVFIAYGKGTNDATSKNYNLESEILSGLTLLGNSVSITDNGYVVASSIKNTANESITVRELGIFETTKSEYGDRSTFMLTRNVLETPITISSNETKTFTITINF